MVPLTVSIRAQAVRVSLFLLRRAYGLFSFQTLEPLTFITKRSFALLLLFSPRFQAERSGVFYTSKTPFFFTGTAACLKL